MNLGNIVRMALVTSSLALTAACSNPNAAFETHQLITTGRIAVGPVRLEVSTKGLKDAGPHDLSKQEMPDDIREIRNGLANKGYIDKNGIVVSPSSVHPDYFQPFARNQKELVRTKPEFPDGFYKNPSLESTTVEVNVTKNNKFLKVAFDNKNPEDIKSRFALYVEGSRVPVVDRNGIVVHGENGIPKEAISIDGSTRAVIERLLANREPSHVNNEVPYLAVSLDFVPNSNQTINYHTERWKRIRNRSSNVSVEQTKGQTPMLDDVIQIESHTPSNEVHKPNPKYVIKVAALPHYSISKVANMLGLGDRAVPDILEQLGWNYARAKRWRIGETITFVAELSEVVANQIPSNHSNFKIANSKDDITEVAEMQATGSFGPTNLTLFPVYGRKRGDVTNNSSAKDGNITGIRTALKDYYRKAGRIYTAGTYVRHSKQLDAAAELYGEKKVRQAILHAYRDGNHIVKDIIGYLGIKGAENRIREYRKQQILKENAISDLGKVVRVASDKPGYVASTNKMAA